MKRETQETQHLDNSQKLDDMSLEAVSGGAAIAGGMPLQSATKTRIEDCELQGATKSTFTTIRGSDYIIGLSGLSLSKPG